MKHNTFKFTDYPQISFSEWKNHSVFQFEKMGFFTTTKSHLSNLVFKENLHYKFLSAMIILKEISNKNFYNIYDQYYCENKKTVLNNLWTSFMDYHFYKNQTVLGYALSNVVYYIDDQLFSILNDFEILGKFEIYYNENYAMNYLTNCKYNSDGYYLGNIIFPNIEKKYKLLSDNKDKDSEEVIKNNDNTIDSIKKSEAQILKDEAKSLVLEQYQSSSEEEKIIIAEKFITNFCYYSEGKSLINDIKSLYKVHKKYKNENILIEHSYQRLINKDLLDFLFFIDIYKNEKNELLLENLRVLTKSVKTLKDKFFDDINTLIKVKNRLLISEQE